MVVLVEIAGWLLVVVGVAALFLPGPGLLFLFSGLALLSQRYEWARKRVDPVKDAALRTAAQSVQTWPRIATSVLGVITMVAIGVFWGLQPPAPSWWPIRDSWWLIGGWGTGATIIASAVIALGTVGYSFYRFRGVPKEEIENDIVGHHR